MLGLCEHMSTELGPSRENDTWLIVGPKISGQWALNFGEKAGFFRTALCHAFLMLHITHIPHFGFCVRFYKNKYKMWEFSS